MENNTAATTEKKIRNNALCIGINYYQSAQCLQNCVKDATNIADAIRDNADGSPNFNVESLHAEDEATAVSRAKLRREIEALFRKEGDIALLYFSGHGATDEYGSYLCASDTEEIGDCFSMDMLMSIIRQSKAKYKIIILDSCHSGSLGNLSGIPDSCVLPENTTILAACPSGDVTYEGIFTPLLVDALNGGAMNLVGEVTPGSVYSYVDRSLGFWLPHPVFKANIDKFVCIKKCNPPISRRDLTNIVFLFMDPDDEFELDPSYEEDKRDCVDKTRNEKHERVFRLLRKYAALNLVVPVGEEYMYWAAVHSKSCRLTAQGRHYWNLAATGRI